MKLWHFSFAAHLFEDGVIVEDDRTHQSHSSIALIKRGAIAQVIFTGWGRGDRPSSPFNLFPTSQTITHRFTIKECKSLLSLDPTTSICISAMVQR